MYQSRSSKRTISENCQLSVSFFLLLSPRAEPSVPLSSLFPQHFCPYEHLPCPVHISIIPVPSLPSFLRMFFLRFRMRVLGSPDCPLTRALKSNQRALFMNTIMTRAPLLRIREKLKVISICFCSTKIITEGTST